MNLFATYSLVISVMNGVDVTGNYLDLIAGADFPFASDGDVESHTTAGEALHHIGQVKLNAQLEARKTRLGHDFRGTNRETVAKGGPTFQHSFGGGL